MEKQYKDGDLQVWWAPNLNTNIPFNVDVSSVNGAIEVLGIFRKYIEFLNDNSVNHVDTFYPRGLNVFNEDDCEWSEWFNVYGETINEVMSK
jgi:hypothetical protein